MSTEETRTVFGTVAERYDRARPGYPRAAAEWLVGPGPLVVLELGAGTGKLTEHLTALGHDVLATDPDARMLRMLEQRAPDARATTGSAERINLPDRSVDIVVCAQSFHWFDHDRAVPEIARVLRPEGVLAMVWNERDVTTPWVRKLGRLIGNQDLEHDPVAILAEFREFGWVEDRSFRHWHDLGRAQLIDLVASRSEIAALDQASRDAVLSRVAELYDSYDRTSMRLPYVTRCFRAAVRHRQPEPDESPEDHGRPAGDDGEDPGTLLIDFR